MEKSSKSSFKNMKDFFQNRYKLIILVIMTWFLVVSILTAWNDSATYDEVAHIPAGYSYLTENDMRLNPEHPPLIKDLAAFPLLFMNLNFDTSSDFWTKDNVADSQWNAGRSLLYGSGNNPDQILFWSRIPLILLSALLGLFIFKWTRELAGITTGLLALTLYSFSPSILGHNHYVTTDIGIAAFITFSFYYFLRFIKKPTWKNAYVGGIFLGLVHIAKFSSVILLPIFMLILIGYPLIKKFPERMTKENIHKKRFRILGSYIGKGLVAFIISILLIWVAYVPTTFNMPAEKINEAINYYFHADDPNIKTIYTRKVLFSMNEVPLLKPLAEYTFGLTRVFQRVAGGNSIYFLGEVSDDAFVSYFPIVFLLKESIPLLILILLTSLFTVYQIFSSIEFGYKESAKKAFKSFLRWTRAGLIQYTLFGFIVLYSYLSITGNLNIGLRHLFPIFPFLYILVAKKIHDFFKEFHDHKMVLSKYLFAGLLIWLIFEPIANYPYYMSYFNQFAGGPKNGYNYVTDSNADWGQDLKRLEKFLGQHPEINKIRVNYFGGGSPEYYLGDKYIQWWDSKRPIEKGWYAISANFLQESTHDNRLNDDGTRKKLDGDSWKWILDYPPAYQVGTSIFIYHVK